MPYDPNDPEAKYKDATESLSDAEITRLAQATDASGKFQDLTSTRSRAGAQYLLEQGQLADPGVTAAENKVDLAQLDKDYAVKIDALVGKIPMQGDLAQLSSQLGLSQREIVELRRRQAGDSVTGDEGNTGELEKASFAERSALGQGATGAGTASPTYWDASRGVNVHAPQGKHFELLPGGGVRLVNGPVPAGSTGSTSSLFAQPTQGAPGGGMQATPGFTQDQLGVTPAAGKTIKRTGQTLFNSQTGVDVHAGAGEIVVEYEDGTFEIRKHSAINQPGTPAPVTQAGQAAEQLGITRQTEIKAQDGSIARAPMTAAQALAAAGTPEEKEAVIQGEGLSGTENFELVGASYTTASGAVRTADAGYTFYQDKKTRRIVQRPISQQQFAAPTTSPSILAQRQQAQPEQKMPTVADFGIPFDPQSFQRQPISSAADLYKQTLDAFGISGVRTQLDFINDELEKADNEFAKANGEIDGNPWYSEGLRARKHDALKTEFDAKRALLVNRLGLLNDVNESAKADARFLVSSTIQQQQFQANMDMQQLQLAYDRADESFSRQIQLANLQLTTEQREEQRRQFETNFAEGQRQFGISTQLDIARLNKPSGGGSPYAGIREVQGGLYNLNTGQFIVPPKSEEPRVLNEQSLQTLYGQWATQNSGLGRAALESQAATGGLDPKSAFVQNTIGTVTGKSSSGVFGTIRKFLGF